MFRKIISSIPVFTLSIITVGAILYLTLTPQPLPDVDVQVFEGIDKVAHFLMMYGLTGIVAFDCLRLKRHNQCQSAPLALITAITLGTIVFGGGIEILQGMMEYGRGCDITDFIADTFGSLAAAATVVALWPTVSRWYH